MKVILLVSSLLCLHHSVGFDRLDMRARLKSADGIGGEVNTNEILVYGRTDVK